MNQWRSGAAPQAYKAYKEGQPGLLLLVFCSAACCGALGLPAARAASDPSNLSQGQPLEVEDAEPTEPGRKADSRAPCVTSARTSEGQDRVLYEPGLQFGLAPGWQGTVSARFFSGSADKTGSGNVRLDVLRQFLRETANTPALALSGQAELPAGQDSEGVDTRLKFILSRTLGGAPSLPRLHLNVGWKHNDKKQPGELGDGYLPSWATASGSGRIPCWWRIWSASRN
jgi:hypothetical protein